MRKRSCTPKRHYSHSHYSHSHYSHSHYSHSHYSHSHYSHSHSHYSHSHSSNPMNTTIGMMRRRRHMQRRMPVREPKRS
jgi:hypothetical protein